MIVKAVGGFGSTAKVCAVSECRARLLGMQYVVATLDDGRVIALCRPCHRKATARSK